MAKTTKKATTKKAKKTVTAAPAPEGSLMKADAEPTVLTPRQYLEAGLARAEAAKKELELAIYAMNDGASEFFKGMEELQRHKHGKALQDYVQKSTFAIASLVDELSIVLKVQAAAKKDAPTFEVDTSISKVQAVAGGAAAAEAPLEQLQKGHAHLALVLQSFAQHEIIVAQGKQFFEAGEYLRQMVKQLELGIARAEAAQ